jgi:predicted nucleic acid-binding protein
MDKPSVYIETSIVSYLAARPSRDALTLRNQQLTHEWWNTRRERYALYTSDAVVAEAQKGDSAMAAQRLALLSRLSMLGPREDVTLLSDEIRHSLRLPEHAATDALHIAFAAVYRIECLLTWNCTHIANPALLPRIERVCRLRGVDIPLLCTPQFLLGE